MIIRLIHGAIVFVLLSACMPAECQTLLAHYPFNGDANDKSGNNNNGKIIGGVTAAPDRFGNPCGALSFDGITGFIEVPDSKSLRSITGSFSVTCWFKIDKLNNPDGFKWLTLVCKGDERTETADNPQYRVQTFQSPLQSTISINTAFTEYDVNFAQHGFLPGQWLFYSLVYDSRSVSAYLNAYKIWEFPFSERLVSNDKPLHIGKDIPGVVEYYYGAFDDLRIYRSALSEKQIRDNYNDTTGSHFDDEFILTCIDDIEVSTEKGACYATVNYTPPALIVNCGKTALNQVSGLPSGSRFPAGDNLIAYSAQSTSGYIKTCYSYITVKDNEPPVIMCENDTLLIINDNSPGVEYNFAYPPAFDNCELKDVKLIQGLPSGSVFPIGETIQLFLATDKYGNQSECKHSVLVSEASGTAVTTVPTILPLPFIPDSIDYQYDLDFKTCDLTLVMYDDCIQDFDTVSVYFNTKPLVEQECIKLKSNGSIVRVISLNRYTPNELVVKAWNIGEISPNTLKIEFYEGDYTNKTNLLLYKRPVKVEILHSLPGIAGAILLKCKE